MYCKNCGAQIADDSRFCPNCGITIDEISKRAANNGAEKLPIGDSTNIETEMVKSIEVDSTLTKEKDGTSEGVKDKENWKKLFEYKVYLPVVAILVVLSVLLARIGQRSSKNNITDLAVLIDCTEDQVAEIYGCDINEYGYYPNEDNINVYCMDGSVYNVMLNERQENDSKYTIKGISVGKNLDEESDLFDSFTQDYAYEIVDGIRYAFTEKSTGYLLMIDADQTNRIMGISYTWDNSTVDDMVSENQEEPKEEVETLIENTTEIKEEQQNEDYTIPPSSEGIFADESESANYTGYSNEYLCELASLYYGICNDCTEPMVEVDSVDGNIVTIHLWEGDGMNDEHVSFAWYSIDRTTGKGHDAAGEEIDITVVERYLLSDDDFIQ